MTRSGIRNPITLRSTKVSTPDQIDRHDDAEELDQHLPGIAFDQPGDAVRRVAGSIESAATANTPVSSVPIAPPTPCTPNTSSESS